MIFVDGFRFGQSRPFGISIELGVCIALVAWKSWFVPVLQVELIGLVDERQRVAMRAEQPVGRPVVGRVAVGQSVEGRRTSGAALDFRRRVEGALLGVGRVGRLSARPAPLGLVEQHRNLLIGGRLLLG